MQDFKESGNKHFKAQEYQLALQQYELGLQEESEDDSLKAVMYCNAALCYKNLEEDDLFLKNINLSIEKNPNYEKPLQLRANYYYKQEKWEESYEDHKILREKFSKENQSILKDLEVKVQKINEERKKEVVEGLKNIGNSVLGYFGMSLDNFKLNQGEGGGYNISYQK